MVRVCKANFQGPQAQLMHKERTNWDTFGKVHDSRLNLERRFCDLGCHVQTTKLQCLKHAFPRTWHNG